MIFNEKTLQRIQSWEEGPFDPKTKEEIARLQIENPAELNSAFFKDLSFGTGGMRGVMGVGTNRINIYTIRIASQGVANYLKKEGVEKKALSLFIGYDTRKNSRLFAEESGRVFAKNGMRVLLTKTFCPTPLVSFACRHFHCDAAIMITASHNPPEYNGYKVYWKDGGQLVFPHDANIMAEVNTLLGHPKESFEHLALLPPLSSPLIHWVGEELDAAYLEELKSLPLGKNSFAQDSSDKDPYKIVYTNLHGTGIRIIPQTLLKWGFPSISLVSLQMPPDEHFRNAPIPNPEEQEALALGTKQLLKTKSDLLLATDPDADRMGAVIRVKDKAVRLSGNQIASLLLYHICSSLKEKDQLPKHWGVIKTIVTTELFRKIGEDFGGICADVLTGFKYIGEMIERWGQNREGPQFLFGAEESYGYLYGSFVRDKDAISSSCLLAEMGAKYKAKQMTLVDLLDNLYRKYGVHREKLISFSFPESAHGMEQMQSVMKNLREKLPSHIGDPTLHKIIQIEDFTTKIANFPKSDVLRFWLANRSKLVIRPSGTEPKIKVYIEVAGNDLALCDAELDALAQNVQKMINSFLSSDI